MRVAFKVILGTISWLPDDLSGCNTGGGESKQIEDNKPNVIILKERRVEIQTKSQILGNKSTLMSSTSYPSLYFKCL